MNAHGQEHGDYRFLIGLITGSVVGAGIAMVVAPRLASEARKRTKELTHKAQGVRDDICDAVARRAHEVERRATAAKTTHGAETRAALDG
jgi:gas vesicle protein